MFLERRCLIGFANGKEGEVTDWKARIMMEVKPYLSCPGPFSLCVLFPPKFKFWMRMEMKRHACLCTY